MSSGRYLVILQKGYPGAPVWDSPFFIRQREGREMDNPKLYYIDFGSLTIEAESKKQAHAILLQRLEEGHYPDLFIHEEVRPTLRRWPLDTHHDPG
jgi:hypothetical protein